MDKLYEKYENFILLRDFNDWGHNVNINAEMTADAMQIFCDTYNIKSLVKEPTCFKNVINPSCIDLILTNGFSSHVFKILRFLKWVCLISTS